jgi:hypothetical protein
MLETRLQLHSSGSFDPQVPSPVANGNAEQSAGEDASDRTNNQAVGVADKCPSRSAKYAGREHPRNGPDAGVNKSQRHAAKEDRASGEDQEPERCVTEGDPTDMSAGGEETKDGAGESEKEKAIDGADERAGSTGGCFTARHARERPCDAEADRTAGRSTSFPGQVTDQTAERRAYQAEKAGKRKHASESRQPIVHSSLRWFDFILPPGRTRG